MRYFGYQKGIGGKPTPVLWHDMPTDGHDIELTEDVYYKFPLSGEDETLSFEQLKEKHPFVASALNN